MNYILIIRKVQIAARCVFYESAQRTLVLYIINIYMLQEYVHLSLTGVTTIILLVRSVSVLQCCRKYYNAAKNINLILQPSFIRTTFRSTILLCTASKMVLDFSRTYPFWIFILEHMKLQMFKCRPMTSATF